MKHARLFIADDHEITRIGIKSILAKQAYEICGEAADGRNAVEQVVQLRPDVVILDVGLPALSGVEVARRIGLSSPQSSVLIFTEIDSEQVMLETLRNGVKGFILKSDTGDELLAAVDAVLKGRTCFNSRINELLLNIARGIRMDILSGREREITQLIAEGLCSKEIAQSLIMSVKTVETHRSNIMRKLAVHSTAELILYAVRNQIVHVQCMPSQPSHPALAPFSETLGPIADQQTARFATAA